MAKKLLLWFGVCAVSAAVTVLSLKILDGPLGIRKRLGIQGPAATTTSATHP
ncbi:MAG TPA: hypothetical protein VME43_13485 [Bryobacteraceae bacterium]|nr:hypothetical protein [Bryobacteraceae bacterium]